MENCFASTSIKDGVLRQLLKNSSTEFTLDAGEMPAFQNELQESRIDKVFKFDEFAPFINLDCIQADDNEESLSKTPFEQLKQKMTSVTEDGKVSKLLLRHGVGEVVPNQSVVYFHYNSYLEMEEVPFDSSYLRSTKPIRMNLGSEEMYLGFKKSILTMKENEKSHFLIDPDYAFGALGAPPRIPPNATILVEIELLKIVDCTGIDNSEEQESEVKTFSEIYSKAKGNQILGNDLFGLGSISAAIDKYRKAEKILLSIKPDSSEEIAKQQELLLKIYINLCVCYNHPKMKTPEKVCSAAKAAFYSCTDGAGKSAKLFFNLGKAFFSLNDYEKASKNLKKALALEPQNQETNKLLIMLEQKKKQYYDHEKETYQRAFKYQKPETKGEKIKPVSEIEKLLKDQLQEFAKNSTNKIQLPADLTFSERNLCQKLSQELHLNYEEIVIGGNLTISITK